jgi:hypothetical protein
MRLSRKVAQLTLHSPPHSLAGRVQAIRRDWFTFADVQAVRAEFDAGPQDLTELSPGVWGFPGLAVVCLGDKAHMRKVRAKRFDDKFRATACPMGHYDDGPPLPPVAERLASLGDDGWRSGPHGAVVAWAMGRGKG